MWAARSGSDACSDFVTDRPVDMNLEYALCTILRASTLGQSIFRGILATLPEAGSVCSDFVTNSQVILIVVRLTVYSVFFSCTLDAFLPLWERRDPFAKIGIKNSEEPCVQ